MNGFLSLGRSILNNQHLQPQILLHLAQMFAQTQQLPELQVALERYTKIDPNNFRANYDLAAVYALRNQPDRAIGQLSKVAKLNPQQMVIQLKQDARFSSLHQNQKFLRVFTDAQRPMAIPQPQPPAGPLAPQPQPSPAQGPLRNPQPAAPANGGGFGSPQGAFGPTQN